MIRCDIMTQMIVTWHQGKKMWRDSLIIVMKKLASKKARRWENGPDMSSHWKCWAVNCSCKWRAWHGMPFIASFHKLFHLFPANIPDESTMICPSLQSFHVAKRPRTPYCIGTLLALFLHLLLPFESEDIEDWLDFHAKLVIFGTCFIFWGGWHFECFAVSEFCWCPNSNRTHGTWWVHQVEEETAAAVKEISNSEEREVWNHGFSL